MFANNRLAVDWTRCVYTARHVKNATKECYTQQRSQQLPNPLSKIASTAKVYRQRGHKSCQESVLSDRAHHIPQTALPVGARHGLHVNTHLVTRCVHSRHLNHSQRGTMWPRGVREAALLETGVHDKDNLRLIRTQLCKQILR